MRPGDTTKPNPFTIVIISNPALEAPLGSGTFLVASITSDQTAFDQCAAYIDTVLFGDLPNQSETFIADDAIAPNIKVVSLFTPGLPQQDSNSLVGQDGSSTLLIARRNVFVPFVGLRPYGRYSLRCFRLHHP